MNNKVKMALPFVLASFAMTASAVAGEHMKPNGCQGPSLCHCYPELDSNNLYLDVGFILEQMRITGTDYAYKLNGTYGNLPADGSMLRPKFKLDWGVTAAIGYHFMHDDWFLRVGFDWLKSIGRGSEDTNFSQALVPINIWKDSLLAGDNVTSFNNAKDSFKVNFYDLMIDLNKGTYFTGCFCFEPHAGLKLAWIFYDNTVSFTNGTSDSPHVLVREMKDNFWGIGPSFGMNMCYFLAEGFSLFMDNNVAVLFGNANVSDYVHYSSNVTLYNTLMKDAHVVMSPAVRALLGVKYDQNVYCDKQHITIRAGLDTNFYWNQFNHINALFDGHDRDSSYNFVGAEDGSFGMLGLLVDFAWEF